MTPATSAELLKWSKSRVCATVRFVNTSGFEKVRSSTAWSERSAAQDPTPQPKLLADSA